MRTHWNDFNQMIGAMDIFRNRMNRLLGDFDQSNESGPGWSARDTAPRTNLCDTGDNLEITAEVPGIAKEDLSVKIQGNYLEIRGTRKPDIPQGYTVHRTERNTTSFSRSFTLPYDIDASRVEASLKEGILRLILPKSETAKPKQISIS